MDRRATEHHSDARAGSIDLRDHASLLVRYAADHEDNNVLRLVSRLTTALDEWIEVVFQPALDQVLQRALQPRRVLRVDVFDALEAAVESLTCAAEKGSGLEQVWQSAGSGGSC